MESKDIFEEKKKLYENIDKDEIDTFKERIQTKLALRKQKYNEILNKKRLFSIQNKNGNISKWKLLYDINKEKIEMENKYKFNFNINNDEEILSLSLKYLKTENIAEIKYSIILLQIFINKHMNSELTNYINLLFIYDLFHIIEEHITDKQIVFNILYIIINYSNINSDKNLCTILLSPNSYKIWELCFNLQDYEILYEIVAILNNIISENQIGGYNLIRSNFLLVNLFNFFMSQSIISNMNNNNKKDLINTIIEDGIILFCKLLVISTDNLDRFTKEEIFISKQKIIQIVIIYNNSNLITIYQTCLFSIYTVIQSEKRLFDEFDKYNYIQNILNNKKYFENEIIGYYINIIVGNYIAYKNKIKYNLLVDIINFEKEYLNLCSSSSHRKEVFWTLSNAIISDKNIINEILKENEFFINIIFYYKNSCSYSEIKEISYFIGILLNNSNIKQFIQIEAHKLMEIVVDHAKKSLENDEEGLVIIFELIEFYLSYGKIMEKYFNGKNIIFDKFNKLGGQELLDKYINASSKALNDQILYILKEFYQK